MSKGIKSERLPYCRDYIKLVSGYMTYKYYLNYYGRDQDD